MGEAPPPSPSLAAEAPPALASLAAAAAAAADDSHVELDLPLLTFSRAAGRKQYDASTRAEGNA